MRGISLVFQGTWIDFTVDSNSFAGKDLSALRALHARIIRQLPKSGNSRCSRRPQRHSNMSKCRLL